MRTQARRFKIRISHAGLLCYGVFLLLAGPVGCTAGSAGDGGWKIPVIYCSDLFHPHDDPDDHFDLATLYAIEEFDIRCIILDQGERQAKAPGRIPVAQMNHLTGRNVPCVSGLSRKLTDPNDGGRNQPERDQEGVRKILEVLRSSPRPVTLITVGSLRDVAAAFNRDPGLCRGRIAKMFLFIGEAGADTREWNVGLDPNAFICIMNSGLPIRWIPCFDGGNFKNKGNASFWRAAHSELLGGVSDRLMNFFLFALNQLESRDPLGYIEGTVDPKARDRALGETRNLWGSAVFLAATGRRIVKDGDGWRAVPEGFGKDKLPDCCPFRFVPVKLRVDDQARVIYGDSESSHLIHRFQITDPDQYPKIMTSLTRRLLEKL